MQRADACASIVRRLGMVHRWIGTTGRGPTSPLFSPAAPSTLSNSGVSRPRAMR